MSTCIFRRFKNGGKKVLHYILKREKFSLYVTVQLLVRHMQCAGTFNARKRILDSEYRNNEVFTYTSFDNDCQEAMYKKTIIYHQQQ